MKEEIPYELIASFLAGETGEEQNRRLQEWIDQSPENKRVFDDSRAIWGGSLVDYRQMEKTKDQVLKHVLSKTSRRKVFKPLLYAACLAGALMIGALSSVVILNRTAKPSGDITVTTALGQKAETTLPDGTKIWINSGTTISYPSDYGVKNRIARLVDGEIYLEVTKSESQPFILETPDGFVKVHGTSFNVEDYLDDDEAAISLKEGSIEHVSSDGVFRTMMDPGQMVRIDKKTGHISLSSCDAENEALWHDGELKLERMNAQDIIKKIERWYGVEINVTGNINNENYYWMTIKTESLRELLSLIDKVVPISYEIEGKKVSVHFE